MATNIKISSNDIRHVRADSRPSTPPSKNRTHKDVVQLLRILSTELTGSAVSSQSASPTASAISRWTCLPAWTSPRAAVLPFPHNDQNHAAKQRSKCRRKGLGTWSCLDRTLSSGLCAKSPSQLIRLYYFSYSAIGTSFQGQDS